MATRLLTIERETTALTISDEIDSLAALASATGADARPEVRDALLELEAWALAFELNQMRMADRTASDDEVRLPSVTTKLLSTTIIELTARVAVMVLGPETLVAPDPDRFLSLPVGTEGWRRQVFRSLSYGIAGGTSNIQKSLIADQGLRLPRRATA